MGEIFFDCTIGQFQDIGPIEISTQELADGSLGISYSQSISSEIKFEPDDDKYTYEYTYTANQLPNGFTYRDDGRSLVIEGVPQVTGVYPILIEVYSPTLDSINSDLTQGCRPDSKASKHYMLFVD